MMPEPIITRSDERIAVDGQSFSIHEWRGSGPGYLHIHYADDEAWHVLEGTLRFRFANKEVDVTAGTTVFVPAGVPHDYRALGEDTRYIIILTPRLKGLIEKLHTVPFDKHKEIIRKYQSEIVE